jgi:uncharacterized membrane protein YbhN (UPF0104 family)
MRNEVRLLVRYCFKVAATAIALGIVLNTIDWERFWSAIQSAHFNFLALAILLFFPIQALSAYRWYFILTRLGEVLPFRTVLHYYILSQFSSLVLPGQISGDIVKLLLASRGRLNKLPIAMSVAIDKLSVLLGVAIIVLSSVFGFGPVSSLTAIQLVATAIIIVTVPIIWLVCQFRQYQSEPVWIRLVERVPFVGAYVVQTSRSLFVLPPIPDKAIVTIIISALCLLACYAGGAYLVALAMNIAINPVDWIAIVAIVSFVQIFPLTVGGLGVREGTFGIILSLYGVEFSQAVVFSLAGFVLGALLTSMCWLSVALLNRDIGEK